MSDMKNDRFFSLNKLFWTIIYDLLFLGLLGSYVIFQVQVMGNDVGPRQSARR